MSWLQALLLGLVQGLTEFLPVSSSGHLMIFRELLGVDSEGFMDFTVMVHFATVLSTLVVFSKPVWDILKGVFKFRYNDQTDYALKIVVSMVPVAVVGLFFKDKVEALFGDSLLVVGISLTVTAALLFFSDIFGKRKPSQGQQGPSEARNGISVLQAFIVGCAQAVAVVPGLSRSGTTIAACLISGFDRRFAVKYSFIMSIPAVLGAAILELKDISTAALSGTEILYYVIGMAVAAVVGYICIKTMLVIVRNKKFTIFSIYCLIIGALSIGGYFYAQGSAGADLCRCGL